MLYKTEEYQGLNITIEQFDNLYVLRVLDADGHLVGRCKAIVADSHLNGAVVKAMGLGALWTEPVYRRGGMARHCFQLLGEVLEQTGCVVSYLHPFSFNYYRTIGYERVCDHRTLELPISTLEFVPRNPELTHVYLGDDVSVLDDIYNRFAATRNIMFQRHNSGSTEKHPMVETYMDETANQFRYRFKKNSYYYTKDENGQPDGYVSFRKEMDLVHHYLFGKVIVDEICYTSPDALRRLLGFIRMFDGEVDTVIFPNIGGNPEVERMLRDYKYTKIATVPDISARFHDVGAVLSVVSYPMEKGSFTVKVTDCEKSPFSKANSEGIWHVDYENGKGTVTRLADDAACDITFPMAAFTQAVHGFDAFGLELARYMEGVVLHNDCPDFFRAFPNRANGLFDLF